MSEHDLAAIFMQIWLASVIESKTARILMASVWTVIVLLWNIDGMLK